MKAWRLFLNNDTDYTDDDRAFWEIELEKRGKVKSIVRVWAHLEDETELTAFVKVWIQTDLTDKQALSSVLTLKRLISAELEIHSGKWVEVKGL